MTGDLRQKVLELVAIVGQSDPNLNDVRSARADGGRAPGLWCVRPLTRGNQNAALQLLQCEAVMNEIVDIVLKTYELMGKLDADRLTQSREKISAYLETLASTGQRDSQKLAVYGLAYLKQLHDGPDPRYSGC